MKAKVNNRWDYDLEKDSSCLDFKKQGDGTFSVIYKKKHYNADVVSVDFKKKMFVLCVNNTNYEVLLTDRHDELLKSLGFSSFDKDVSPSIVSPMPGKVINVLVSESSSFSKGDPLIVLEAMKMENIIKAEGQGVVGKIKVKTGDVVEKNAVLISVKKD